MAPIQPAQGLRQQLPFAAALGWGRRAVHPIDRRIATPDQRDRPRPPLRQTSVIMALANAEIRPRGRRTKIPAKYRPLWSPGMAIGSRFRASGDSGVFVS